MTKMSGLKGRKTGRSTDSDLESSCLLPRDDESYPCAEPVRVLSVAIATVTDPEIARLSSRVLTLSALLCVCDLVTFIYSAILDHNYGFAALAALMLGLLLPVCGFTGVRQRDGQMLMCFWVFSFVFCVVHAVAVGILIVWITQGYKASILYPLIGNCIVSCMLYLSFIWGKDLHSKAYWDDIRDEYDEEDQSIVSILGGGHREANAQEVQQAVVMGQPVMGEKDDDSLAI
jgi:hypothetical protein